MITNLIKYDQNYLVYPFGLYNNSIICYFNSLIQALLTCTSLNDYLLNNENKYKNHKFLKIYIDIIKKYIVSDNHTDNILENLNIILFNEFLNLLKGKNMQFGYNQEDSGELLILLLDIINDPYIYKLFNHNYKCNIYCKNCKKLTDIKNDISIQFEMDDNTINNNYMKYQIDSQLHNINKFIRNNYSELDNYVCNNCKDLNTIKINRLIMIPTIIVINLNKYIKKYNYNYPLELKFINNDINKQYNYKLVSTINHSGNTNYGHYVTKGIRKNYNINNNINNTQVFILNDNSYQKDSLKPELNTYILFYHFVDEIEYYKE